MFFRPSFCAHCGEKIERSDWGLFTSRRFCAVCEVEFKGVDILPRATVAFALLVGVLGVGAYLKSGNAEPRITKPVAQPIERPAAASIAQLAPGTTVPTPVPQQSPPANTAPGMRLAQTSSQTTAARSAVQDVVYTCGAQTKKGTPCSRRIHGAVRCYQHVGMPAMMPQEKLRVN